MYEKAEEESKREFAETLSDIGLSRTGYQVLECLFRQSVMLARGGTYAYQDERSEPVLAGCGEMHQKRMELALTYIGDWENKTKLEYGFERVKIDNFEVHQALIGDYTAALSELKKFASRYKGIITETSLSGLVKEMQKELIRKMEIPGNQPGRFIRFDSNLLPELSHVHFDYFTVYLGLSYGIFHQFFHFSSELSEAHGKTPFFRFIAAKIRREHDTVSGIEQITAKYVRDRIKKNQPGAEQIAKVPLIKGIVTTNFLEFLAEQNHSNPAFEWRRKEAA